MSLNFPHQYSGNDQVSRATSQDNLDKLQTSVKIGQTLTRQDVVTKEALEHFDFIKANRNGCGHRCKKYTAVAASFTAGTILPFGALTLLGKYIYDSSCLSTEGVSCIPGAIAQHPYILASGAGIVALEVAAGRIGFSVLKPMAHGVATGYALLVNTLTKGVIRSYDNDSTKKETTNKEKHKEMVDNLKNTYSGIADALFERFNEVRNTPSQLLELQNDAGELLGANPQFVKALQRLEINSVDVETILGKFKATLEKIRNEKIALRTGSDEQDIAYNANLLTHFPTTAEHCIPAKVQQRIAAAKAYELGILHTAKSSIATVVAGTLSSVAVPAAAFASTFMCSNSPVTSFTPDLSKFS